MGALILLAVIFLGLFLLAALVRAVSGLPRRSGRGTTDGDRADADIGAGSDWTWGWGGDSDAGGGDGGGGDGD